LLRRCAPRNDARRYIQVLALAGCVAISGPTFAADKLRAGKAVEISLPLAILDLGVHQGIFAQYGIDLDISNFTSDTKLQQAFAANAVDVGLGGGPAMAFEIKGSQAITVAAFAGPPGTIAVATLPDSPIETVADLKGKTLAVAASGSLTEWLTKRLSAHEGWGPDGIKTVALGAGAAMNGALFTHQVDAMMTGTENVYILADKGQARLVAGAESFVPDFIAHVVFARKDLVASNPDLIDRFLKGLFASIRFAKANKAATTAYLGPLLNESPPVIDKVYDHETAILIDDGRFDPKAMAILEDSFIDMGILASKPSDDQLFTTRFVPVKL
jgi:ABC-type nitrate/sulfonate/bicarbonate transport system substrate-binding protein